MTKKPTVHSNRDLRIEVNLTQPLCCPNCSDEGLNRVELHGSESRPFIRRLAEKATLGILWPKLAEQLPLYGWCCAQCGYVMWFTERLRGDAAAMKEKNDFKSKKNMAEVIAPHHCLQCQSEALEQVELRGTNSRFFIQRRAETSLWNRIFPRQHPIYGWRCMNCGYIMLSTARYLD